MHVDNNEHQRIDDVSIDRISQKYSAKWDRCFSL